MRGRDLLTRFRPVGAPGAAGPVGVPAESEHEAAAELAAVFAALAPTLADCRRIRAQADEAGARLVAASRAEAEETVRRAGQEAPALRARATARVQQLSEDEARSMLEQARTEAERLRTAGRQALPRLVDATIARLRADLGLPDLPRRGEARP